MAKRKRLLTNESRRGINRMANLAAARFAVLDDEECEQLFDSNDPTGEGDCACATCTERYELTAALQWLKSKLTRKQ